MKTRILTAIVFGVVLQSTAQTFTETITKELSFEKKGTNNTLMIFNINGDVKVEGTAGDKILVEVVKRVYAKTETRLEKGKQEIQLGVLDRADTMLLYVAGVCNEFGKLRKKNGNWNDSRRNGWGYNWNDCRSGDCNNKDYDYKMDFTIKVPANISVFASTVNDGDVEITNVSGYLMVDNINGSIHLKNISGATRASTINGDVDFNYSSNPSGDSRYYTLNGNINAYFKKGLGAQLTFKSFNGEFFSSLDDITPMAVTVEKYEKGEGVKYRVNGNRYKVRQGGPLLDFETFNGDVYLREN